MAVLLMALSVMAILMTIAMPVWKHDAQREKETELVFRGEQYGRSLTLFQRKRGPGVTPPTVQALLDDHVLRKKYKDPITGDDFDELHLGQNAPGSTTPAATSGRGGTTTSTAPQGSSTAQRGTGPGTPSTNGPSGGIVAFASKSKAESIRIYKGHSHYNEWQFTAAQLAQAPGAGAPGSTVPGVGGPGRGGPQGPGGLPGTGGPGGRGVGPGGGRGVTFGPNGQVIGPNGQPVIDPRTGQPLVIQPGGAPGGRGRGN
jgi:type II secretory pathway pseudopilin PulG